MEPFHTRRACLPFYFCLGFQNGSKSNVRISALLLHYVQFAMSTIVLDIEKVADADAMCFQSSCTTLLSLLIITAAGITLGPSAFAALCKAVTQTSAICALPFVFFAASVKAILFSAICAPLLSKDFKFAFAGFSEPTIRSAQSGVSTAQLAFVSSLVNHAAYSSLFAEGALTGGVLESFRNDVNKEGDVPFIRGRGTGRFLKRTGRDRELWKLR